MGQSVKLTWGEFGRALLEGVGLLVIFCAVMFFFMFVS